MPPFALLIAACVPSGPTPSPADDTASPSEPTEDHGASALFDRSGIGTVDLLLTDEASAALASDAGTDTWVESAVALSFGDTPVTLDRVGLQVKGSGTFVAWPGKSSLKIKLDAFVDGQDVDGVERIAVHNLVKDPSFLRESLAWWVFRELDAPAARAAHVAVLDRGAANWEPNNLYVAIEAINGDFLEQWFPDPSGPMWEGIAGGLESTGGLYCDRGDCTDASRLEALATAITSAPDDRFVEEVGAWLDWNAFLRYWALETMVEQADGFIVANHNFRVYWEPTRERFFLIPWSLDSTFGHLGAIMVPPDNVLVSRCVALPACHAAFQDELLAVAQEWEEADVLGELDRMQALLVAAGYADEASSAEYEVIREIVASRPAAARAYTQEW